MILDHIIDRVHERRERRKHIELDELPPPEHIDETCFVGGFSISTVKSMKRYIKTPSCIAVDGCVETPSALARDYLTIKYGTGPRVSHEQFVGIMAGLMDAPLYAAPGKFDSGFYVDIKACYWSIMNVAGWNVDYWPRKWLSKATPPNDFPWPRHKVARNTLVSIGRMSDASMWSPEKKYFDVRLGNRLANMQLARLIADVLNSIAYRAKKAGAIYVNNDGYIAPNNKVASAICDIIRDWGLEPNFKGHGGGEVRGPGSYKVGRLKSKVVLDKPTAINKIERVHYDKWLQKKFSYLASGE